MSVADGQGGARGAGWLSLFASAGTLVCCALPIVLVSLGFGAAVAATTSALPLLITLSQHKTWVFAGSALLLALNAALLRSATARCPADPALATRCRRADAWNRRVFIIALGVWMVGFFAAYLALPLARWLER